MTEKLLHKLQSKWQKLPFQHWSNIMDTQKFHQYIMINQQWYKKVNGVRLIKSDATLKYRVLNNSYNTDRCSFKYNGDYISVLCNTVSLGIIEAKVTKG